MLNVSASLSNRNAANYIDDEFFANKKTDSGVFDALWLVSHRFVWIFSEIVLGNV
jgi:hypothetical protein